MNFVIRRNVVKAPLEGALDHKKHTSPAVLDLIGRMWQIRPNPARTLY